MTGTDALLQLQSLIHGRATGDVRAAWDLLVDAGLAVRAEPGALAQADEIRELGERYQARTNEDLKKALAQLETSLRSDLHRMTSFRGTIEREERDRARLRRALGTFEDARERLRIADAERARALADREAQFVPCPGTPFSYAITVRGVRAVGSLQARLDRYGKADFAEFLKRFGKSEAAMEEFAARRRTLARDLPYVAKGKTYVVDGLLKSGLAPEQAIQAYEKALGKAPSSSLVVERPHLAVAFVRQGKEDANYGLPAAQLERLTRTLAARGGFPAGPVLRGAVKALMRMPDPDAAVQRFIDLHAALHASSSTLGDALIKTTARLLSAPGSATEVAGRVQSAIAQFRRISRHPVESELLTAAALTAGARDDAHLGELVARFNDILGALVDRGALNYHAPTCVADLVFCPGTPEEVVELVHEFTGVLANRSASPGWASWEEFDTACGFARRFAY